MKIDIPDFSKCSVLMVGDIMLDRYWHGPTSRISPEAPVPVVNIQATEERPGGAGNVALNIADLGAKATVLGWVGDDEPAGVLERQLTSRNVICRFLPVGEHATVTKLRIISRHQQLIRLDFEDGFAAAEHDKLLKVYAEMVAGHDLVVLSDYGKGTLTDTAGLIRLAREAGKPVLVDPKGTDFSRYRQATAITPNQAEFEAVVGVCVDENDLAIKGQRLMEALMLEALLITRSEKGMLLLRKNREPLQLSTHAREVFDVTGAGDTVIAVLAASLAAGLEFEEATSLANMAAGIVVGKLGTATASVRELQSAMLNHESLRRGVVRLDELLDLVKMARAAGERIVMTNGCFDILHAGHAAYLSQARALGDRLIVAVNDDASVKRLKGPERPVNPLMQRMAVLSALESVDWVVSFAEDTPAKVIEQIAPDVLVKGGDYRVDQVVGADSVKRRGGEVIILPYLDGCSTTSIINAIRKTV
jgi:D-beta-D-heptose 7-phosphate kinase/D-beta-D-heptose 1-phosphate adenosyltransferase